MQGNHKEAARARHPVRAGAAMLLALATAGCGQDTRRTPQPAQDTPMSITVNIYYSGENGSARQFAEEMISSGTVDKIRREPGNLKYDYFFPMGDGETVLLIDSWENQAAIDAHHGTPMMKTIMELREKYNLHMRVERYLSDSGIPDGDRKYIRH